MNEVIFEIIKVVVMLAALLIARYMIPWLREKIGAEKMEQIEKWAAYAVKMAEQVYGGQTGADRKSIVTEFLRKILTAKKIALSEDQLNVLIEAAVKEMNMQQKKEIEQKEE